MEGGVRKLLEWDIWEDRTLKRSVLWSTCTSTVLVSCGFNASAYTNFGLATTPVVLDDAVAAANANDKGGKGQTSPAGTAITRPSKRKDSSKKAKKVGNVGDEEEFKSKSFDFFDDLNVDLAHGRSLLGALGLGFGSTSAASTVTKKTTITIKTKKKAETVSKTE